jgi:20S proteasome alpha/beta subunit
MTFEERIDMALKALKEAIDEDATKENVRLAYVKTDTKVFHMASKEEVEGFLTKLE